MAKELKVKQKASKRKQGSSADPKQLSDDRKPKAPRSEDRGIGSAYAMAIGEALNLEKGSQEGFLGKEKQTIDPKQFAHSVMKKEK